MAALATSRVTFDYAMPQQSGITIRCFEAQSLGVTVLTNNLAAVESGYFDPDSIAYLPKVADTATISALVTDLTRWAPATRRRSLDNFLDDLLSDATPATQAPTNAGDPA